MQSPPAILVTSMSALLCAGCVERTVGGDEPPLTLEEECDRLCALNEECPELVVVECEIICVDPREKWPWLTDGCVQLLYEKHSCLASLTCETIAGVTLTDHPCREQIEAWNDADECFE